MTGKHGVMGLLASVGLVETDEPEIPVATTETQLPPLVLPLSYGASAHIIQAQMCPPFPQTITTTTTTTTTLSPEDETRVKSIEAEIYASPSPSAFVIFNRLRQRLNATTDLSQVFGVLSDTNPDITPTRVLHDLQLHLAALKQQRTTFDFQVSQARKDKIDGPTSQIAQLNAQNQQAQAETVQRADQITQLQASLQQAEQSLATGQAKFKIIEDRLSTPLLQAQQMLQPLTNTGVGANGE